MARYINNFVSTKSDNQIKAIAEDYFYKEGFKLKNVNGELVWKKGTGLLTAPQYIKLCFQNSNVHIEAFLKMFSEIGLDGFVSAIPKQILKSKVNTIEGLIK